MLRPVKEIFYLPVTLFQNRCRFLIGKAFKIYKPKDGSVIGRELGKGLVDGDFPFFFYVGSLKAQFLAQIIFHILNRRIKNSGIAPDMIYRHISSDGV